MITNIFFKPNTEFVKWLIEYANGRMILDVGCGETFPLTKQLIANGAPTVVSIDPYLDMNHYVDYRLLNHDKFIKGSYHGMQARIQDMEVLFSSDREILMIFARPCHSLFVYDAISMKGPNVEVLYITKPENIEEYADVGEYINTATLLKHKGSSADDEVVYSIK